MKTLKLTQTAVFATICGLALAAMTAVSQEAESAAVATNMAATNSANIEAPANPQRAQSAQEIFVQRRGPIVSIGHDVELPAGDEAETVVVIGGSAKILGNVRHGVVVIGGDADVEGRVGDAVVAIGGDDTVASRVGHVVVAVLGNINLKPGASIGENAVSVGGNVDVASGAHVRGQVVQVPIGWLGFPKLTWLKQWLVHCVFRFRPLSLSVGWVWLIAGGFFLLYVLISVALVRPVGACFEQLTSRPATTFLVGLLAKFFMPILFLLLTATGVGVLVVPFLIAAVMLGGLVGKAALLQHFGAGIGRATGITFFQQPIGRLIIGAAIVTVLYIIPFIGLFTLVVTGMWAIGAAVTGLFASLRKERPESPTPAATMPGTTTLASIVPPEGGAGGGVGEGQGGAATQVIPPIAPMGVTPGNHSLMLAYPKAGFFERMAAAFLDLLLLAVLLPVLKPFILLAASAYFAGMWAWKGTTVGGIVLKLQVIRYDGRPPEFPAALVRALAAAFSAAVCFLGFFWIGVDEEKQGWHDKIAGTYVVRVPKAMPLVCL